MLRVTNLRCNHLTTPLTVGSEPPWFSWQLGSDERGVVPTSCRVRVGDVWDSGEVPAGISGLSYTGPPLQGLTSYRWTVDVKAGGEVARGEATLEVGPLTKDWTGQWISLPRPRDVHENHRPLPYLRHRFDLPVAPVKARLYITAGGLYRASLNGTRVGHDELTPGWTDYRKRVHFQGYDVTGQLRSGPNMIGAVLADGWYSGSVGPFAPRELYGKEPCLLAELVMWWPDGTRSSVVTGDHWEGRFGPILAADLLGGQIEDSRLRIGGWAEPRSENGAGEDSVWEDRAGEDGVRENGVGEDRVRENSVWKAVTLEDGPEGLLVGQPCQPPRVVTTLTPRSVTEPLPGSYVFDLGQNMVGRARLRLRAPAGTIVRLRHAEMLNRDGTLYTENLRVAGATDTYIAAGEGDEVFEPEFTFHGFRYVEVTGLPYAPAVEDLTGVVVSSAPETTGHFECSNPMVNQLQSNIRWSQLGNFLEVPTDCPQRDERLGWMGDAQVFAPTACFNADVAAFFLKWLADVSDAQPTEGEFTDVAPVCQLPPGIELQAAAPGWGDAGVIVPWVVYQWYGDRRAIERMYSSAAAWVDRIHKINPDLLWSNGRGFDFGDWLSIEADTPKDLLGTAYFAHSASIVSEMARSLDRNDDAAAYEDLSERIAAAFRDAYVATDGRIAGGTQTAYALAISFDLLTEDQTKAAGEHLAADVEARGVRLSTGFLGVAHLLPALTRTGRLDLAYDLLLSDRFPSWGYPIRHGATTMWERWDGWTEEQGFQTPAMNSFNHYCFGSVGAWMYSIIGGLRSDTSKPGWGGVIVEPRPGGGITWARCSYDSARGPVTCGWSIDGSGFNVTTTIPPGATAEIRLPLSAGQVISESGSPVTDAGLRDGVTHIEIGSGRYAFTVE